MYLILRRASDLTPAVVATTANLEIARRTARDLADRSGMPVTLWEEVEIETERDAAKRLAAIGTELEAIALAIDTAAREAPVSRSTWPQAANRIRRAMRELARAAGVDLAPPVEKGAVRGR